MKKCKKCSQIKEDNCFYQQGSWCKKCRIEYSKNYRKKRYLSDPKYRKKVAQWNRNNYLKAKLNPKYRQKMAEISKAYYHKTHPDVFCVLCKEKILARKRRVKYCLKCSKVIYQKQHLAAVKRYNKKLREKNG